MDKARRYTVAMLLAGTSALPLHAQTEKACVLLADGPNIHGAVIHKEGQILAHSQLSRPTVLKQIFSQTALESYALGPTLYPGSQEKRKDNFVVEKLGGQKEVGIDQFTCSFTDQNNHRTTVPATIMRIPEGQIQARLNGLTPSPHTP